MSEKNLHVVVGLGKTGVSCVRYLTQQGIPVAVTDSRKAPPGLEDLKTKFPQVVIKLGKLNATLMKKAAMLVVSPGVSLSEPAVIECRKLNIPIVGDIELFAHAAKAPVIGITGSNAKGTVTTLLGEMAKTAGMKVLVGGNIGTPALDLLSEPNPDLYVLELSSFQLDTTHSLKLAAATILNISVDHLDRHKTLEHYISAKQRIYRHSQAAIFNRDDRSTWPQHPTKIQVNFGLSEPATHEFGLCYINNEAWLAQGPEKLLPVSKLFIKGKHNWSNALAALALGSAIKLPMPAMLQALQEFKGLPHRCQWVADYSGVQWYNDSKGTNVGATIAAIEGLGAAQAGKIILIAGGLAKGADFSPLVSSVAEHVREVILIGQDAALIDHVLSPVAPVKHAKSMEEAVILANKMAKQGDAVLLSPACASFDMFQNFEHRGDVFTQEVQRLSS